MANTPNLGLPLLAESQAQKHVTVNEAFTILDGLAPLPSGNGGTLLPSCLEEDLTLSGPDEDTSIEFPAGCVIMGVGVRVLTTITGATSFDVGPTGGTVNAFGGSLGLSSGSTNKGVVGPYGNYSSQTVTLTANGSDFTGGTVRVALYFLNMVLPSA